MIVVDPGKERIRVDVPFARPAALNVGVGDGRASPVNLGAVERFVVPENIVGDDGGTFADSAAEVDGDIGGDGVAGDYGDGVSEEDSAAAARRRVGGDGVARYLGRGAVVKTDSASRVAGVVRADEVAGDKGGGRAFAEYPAAPGACRVLRNRVAEYARGGAEAVDSAAVALGAGCMVVLDEIADDVG